VKTYLNQIINGVMVDDIHWDDEETLDEETILEFVKKKLSGRWDALLSVSKSQKVFVPVRMFGWNEILGWNFENVSIRFYSGVEEIQINATAYIPKKRLYSNKKIKRLFYARF